MLSGRNRPRPGRLTGAQALAQLQQVKGRLLDEQLREAGLI